MLLDLTPDALHSIFRDLDEASLACSSAACRSLRTAARQVESVESGLLRSLRAAVEPRGIRFVGDPLAARAVAVRAELSTRPDGAPELSVWTIGGSALGVERIQTFPEEAQELLLRFRSGYTAATIGRLARAIRFLLETSQAHLVGRLARMDPRFATSGDEECYCRALHAVCDKCLPAADFSSESQ